MKNRKRSIFCLALIAVVGVMLPWVNVYAEDPAEGDEATPSIRFETTVVDWKNNNDLQFTCGSSTADVTTINPTVYYGVYEDGVLSGSLQTTTCEFYLNELNGISTGDTFKIIEEYDYSSYQGTTPEFEEVTVRPGTVTSETFDSSSSIFSSYSPTDEETAVVYNMNQVDEDGIIIGGLYVYAAYLDSESKNSQADLGIITIPTYCVKFNFSVRGNIANTYGTFELTVPGSESSIVSNHGGTQTICTIEEEPMSYNNILDILSMDTDNNIAYTGVLRSEDYEKQLDDLGETTEGTVITREVTVIARLDTNGSQTGLIYRVLPFVILIALVGSAYIVMRRNRIKE